MSYYLDSSVVLRHLLAQPNKLDLPTNTRLHTSELLFVECHRVLDRIRLIERCPDEVVSKRLIALRRLQDALDLLQLDRNVLRMAMRPFIVPLRTLDALHLTSALMLHKLHGPCTLLTHDSRLGHAAAASGMKVAGIELEL